MGDRSLNGRNGGRREEGRNGDRSEARAGGRRRSGRTQGWVRLKRHTLLPDTYPKFLLANVARGHGEIVAIRRHPGRPSLWPIIADKEGLFAAPSPVRYQIH